jgi:hypothetical protein
LEVIVHRLIERASQGIDRTTPGSNARKMECRRAGWSYGIEVLVGDGVSPVDKILQQLAAAFVPGIKGINRPPHVDAKPGII